MTPYWTSHDGRHVIHHGDCLEILPTISGVSLVCTDPPYHGVKADDWDNQWSSDAAFLAWVSQVCGLVDGVFELNGSIYWFASPRMAARVECEIAKTFIVLNSLCWFKGVASGGSLKNVTSLRRYWSNTERIIFAERYNEPLLAYLEAERLRSGVTHKAVELATNTQMASHWFTRAQWCLPTAQHYAMMQALFNAGGSGEYLRRDYEDLRRPFSVTARGEWGDVWRFPIERNQVHPTQKPLAMMAHIVKTSSRADGLVLDPFMGSGTTGVACVKLGRRFIGIEIEERYCDIAVKRMERELSQPQLPWMDPSKAVQGTMFET